MNAKTRSTKKTLVRLGGAAVLTVILGAGVVGCSSDSKDEAEPAATTSVAPTTAASASDPTVTTAPAQSNDGGQSNNGQSGNGQSGNSGNGGQPTGPAPVIVSFTTPEDIDCHNGMLQNFSAEWSTTNATKTTISIDGGGVYMEYGPNASESLPFNCSSAHTFVLTAFSADGQNATKSITLQPRNVQPEGSDEEPSDS